MPISPETAPFAAVAILIGGILFGALVARIVLPSRKQLRRLTADLEKLRAEHHAYRVRVTGHFETTSELVANMTASYKAVYDHLATGARSLCEPSKALEAGEFGAPRLVFDDRVDIGKTPPSETAENRDPREKIAGADATPGASSTSASTRTAATSDADARLGTQHADAANDDTPPTLEMKKKEEDEPVGESSNDESVRRAPDSLH